MRGFRVVNVINSITSVRKATTFSAVFFKKEYTISIVLYTQGTYIMLGEKKSSDEVNSEISNWITMSFSSSQILETGPTVGLGHA